MALVLNDHWRVVGSVIGLAEVARRAGEFDRSARLFRAGKNIRVAMGINLRPASERLFNGWLEDIRVSMGTSAFEHAWAAGVALTRDDAARLALGSLPCDATVHVSSPAPTFLRARTAQTAAGLTPRAIEILALLSQRLGNREIAERLFISHRTVMQHVANIFPKIDVSSRATAAAWSRRHQIP